MLVAVLASCSDGRLKGLDAADPSAAPASVGQEEHREIFAKMNGAACTTATDCDTNFCEDGVCCDTLCGGGEPNDCVSCLGSMTGGVDGVCGAVTASAHYVCRPAVGACDVASVCPGGSLLCPPDTFQPAGTVCQVAGACNAAATCSGVSPACPTANSPNGTACGTGEICANGVCSADCDIGGQLVSAGTERPLDACQLCDPAASTSAWSNQPDGTSCATGVCASGACAADCFIGGMLYAGGTVNPNNACQVCTPGNSTTAWSNEPDGLACGGGELCSGGACTSACVIGNVHYASGAVNPGNPCQVCDPAASTSAWSAASNGIDCAVLLVPAGVCDSAACVADCFIGGTFYAAGATNPANACQVCVPGTATHAWTDEPAGTACGAGEVCSGGSCQMACVIGLGIYASGAVNPANACQVCAPSSSTTMWSSEPAGTSCGVDGVCNGTGACAADCFIGGTLYAAGAANPANACQTCVPATSRTAWTNDADGTPCGTGEVCSNGTCADDCIIGNATLPSGTMNVLNPCQVCNPAISTTTFSDQPIGSSCGGGLVCDGTGICTADCFIGGTLYAGGTVNPGNSCQVCAPAASTSTWSDVLNGVVCGTGETCNAGVCARTCTIGGMTYPAGAANPANACQTCDAAVAPSTWTNDADGTTCGFGRVCVGGGCDADCYIGGKAYSAGTANPANPCQECVPTTSTTAWSNEPNGTTCGGGQVCVDGQCGVCTINGATVLPGTVNAANACQVCAPASSSTTWTSTANGTACGAGEVCSAGVCTSGCFIGGEVYAGGTQNPTNPCQVCAPATSTTTWSNQGNGTSCGNGEVCLAGACGACVVNGVTYSAGTVNPANACQLCAPVTSQTSWSSAANGAACAGGTCSDGSCMPSSTSSSGSTSTSTGSASTGSTSTGSGSASSSTGSASTSSGSTSTSGGAGGASSSASSGSTSSGAGGGTSSASSGSTSSGSTSSGSTSSGSTSSGSTSSTSSSSGVGGAASSSSGSGAASSRSASSGAGASGPNEDGVVAEGGGCRCGVAGGRGDEPWLGATLAFLAALALRRRRR